VAAKTAPGHPATPSTAAVSGTAADWIPKDASLSALRIAAVGCRACHLWTLGSQTVFGEGPARARVMLVGEQPGDQEDKAGRPFVGPSGALLDAALVAAGIDRKTVYVTNVVKHFKWERIGRSPRRIHKKPNANEIRACRPWLDAEIAHVRPEVLVCLGATAAQAVLGRTFRVTTSRGVPIPSPIPAIHTVFATVHPSAVLRAPDVATRERAEADFVADLRGVADYLADAGQASSRPARRHSGESAARAEPR
jgi:uracil-DNA glycosylase